MRPAAPFSRAIAASRSDPVDVASWRIEIARCAIVLGCAAALIAAGPALPL